MSPSPWRITRNSHFCDEHFMFISTLKDNKIFTDFTIITEDVHIACHRVLLAAKSPYFMAMFNSGMKEAITGETMLDALDSQVVQDVVDFIYSGNITLNWNKLKATLDAAELLQIADLKQECDYYAASNLTPENCIDWYKIASAFYMKETEVKAKKMKISQFVQVSKGDDFMHLSLVELVDFIKESFNDVTPDKGLEAVIRWVVYEDSRKTFLKDIMEHVDLNKCSTTYVKFILNTYKSDLLTTSPLYKLFTEAALRNEPNEMPIESDGHTKLLTLSVSSDKSKCTDELDKNKNWDIFQRQMVPALLYKRSLMKGMFSVCAVPNGLVMFGMDTTNCYIFNRRRKKWAATGNLSSKAKGCGAVCILNKVYAVGGDDNRRNTLECLDLKTLKWTIHAIMPLAAKTPESTFGDWRPGSTPDALFEGPPIVTSARNMLFVIFNTNRRISEPIQVQCYDPEKKEWSLIAPLPSSVSTTVGASAVGFEDHVFLVGGKAKLCLRYSLKYDVWTACCDKIPIEDHNYSSAIQYKGKIFLTGGQMDVCSCSSCNSKSDDSDSCNSSFQTRNCPKTIVVYETAADSWTQSDIRLPWWVQVKYHAIFAVKP